MPARVRIFGGTMANNATTQSKTETTTQLEDEDGNKSIVQTKIEPEARSRHLAKPEFNPRGVAVSGPVPPLLEGWVVRYADAVKRAGLGLQPHPDPTSTLSANANGSNRAYTVPADILARIFALCAPEEQPMRDAWRPQSGAAALNALAHTHLVELGRVCVSWRAVALETPALWSTIQLDLAQPARKLQHGDCAREQHDTGGHGWQNGCGWEKDANRVLSRQGWSAVVGAILPVCVARAGEAPLVVHISLSGSREEAEEWKAELALLAGVAHRWKTLNVDWVGGSSISDVQADWLVRASTNLPLLEMLQLNNDCGIDLRSANAPSLREVSVLGSRVPLTMLPFPQLTTLSMDLPASATNLTHLLAYLLPKLSPGTELFIRADVVNIPISFDMPRIECSAGALNLTLRDSTFDTDTYDPASQCTTAVLDTFLRRTVFPSLHALRLSGPGHVVLDTLDPPPRISPAMLVAFTLQTNISLALTSLALVDVLLLGAALWLPTLLTALNGFTHLTLGDVCRTWTHTQEGARTHILVDALATRKLLKALAPPALPRLTHLAFSKTHLCFSDEALRRFVCARTGAVDEHSSANAELNLTLKVCADAGRKLGSSVLANLEAMQMKKKLKFVYNPFKGNLDDVALAS